ncbi:MAG: WecB/TagA/CpsF family glycosyltransferase [Lachnospiraceae bacterium]
MRKINLLGIELTDFTLKESLKYVNEYLNNGALNTVSFISTQTLVQAGENEEQKLWLESVDMTICDETDILKAAGFATRNRMREVEEGEFVHELLQRLARRHLKIFLLSDSTKQMEQLQHDLYAQQDGLCVVGEYILDESAGSVDSLINEINDVVPNVILSRFPYPLNEQLMYENKQMMNADIWVALPAHPLISTHRGLRRSKLLNAFYKKLFDRKISQYHDQKAE